MVQNLAPTIGMFILRFYQWGESKAHPCNVQISRTF